MSFVCGGDGICCCCCAVICFETCSNVYIDGDVSKFVGLLDSTDRWRMGIFLFPTVLICALILYIAYDRTTFSWVYNN